VTVTVTTNEDLARVIEYHIGKGHEHGCPGRIHIYKCDCRYDDETVRLLRAAAKEIKLLTDRVGKLEHELDRHTEGGKWL